MVSTQSRACALTNAYKVIGSIVREAEEYGRHTLILRFGRPAAVVVPADWHARAKTVLDRMQQGYVLTPVRLPRRPA